MNKIFNKKKRGFLKVSKFLGNLYFFKRHSNIFLVLSNYKKKHLFTLTSGNCGLGKNKKKKVSPFNMLNLVVCLKKKLLHYNIKFINILIKQQVSRYFFSLKKLLKLNEIKINKYIFLLYKSYSVKKHKTVRRI
jgi:ribosomal protein S11